MKQCRQSLASYYSVDDWWIVGERQNYRLTAFSVNGKMTVSSPYQSLPSLLFPWLAIHVYCLFFVPHHIVSHYGLIQPVTQPGTARGHYSLSSPFSAPCILSRNLFLRSASRRVTHHCHASPVTISLRFSLAFHCITSLVVSLALLKGCCHSTSISLRITHHHDLHVTRAVTVLS